ncbi:cysteine rich repeat-containing protein [Agrobacterium sp. 22-226-1]
MKRYLIIAVMVFAGAAHAQGMNRQQMQQVRAACEANVRKLCSGIQPGGGKLLQCLQQNASSVSTACSTKLMEIKSARQSN